MPRGRTARGAIRLFSAPAKRFPRMLPGGVNPVIASPQAARELLDRPACLKT
jgi:hypothetical protein